MKKLWRYRVGDYRLICDFRDGEKTAVVLALGGAEKGHKVEVRYPKFLEVRDTIGKPGKAAGETVSIRHRAYGLF